MKNTQVARLLAYVTGMVKQQILLQNEYLAAENRILRAHLPVWLRLTDPQRVTLVEIGKTSRPQKSPTSGSRKPSRTVYWLGI
jgi:hypothetical protein